MSATADALPVSTEPAGVKDREPSPERTQEIWIKPASRWPMVNLGELWAYRGLFGFLVWRDIKVRYAQTVLGAGWAVLQPLLSMVVFTLVFGNFAGIPSDGVPYPVFSLAALVPWFYFSGALTGSSSSMIGSTNLITKVYFPRLVIPSAPVIAGLVDLAIGLVILLLAMMYFGLSPSPWIPVLLPVLVLIMVSTAAGTGYWLAALNVKYRDVKYIVPFLIQIWMYASPIVYPISIIPEGYRSVYALNPIVGVVEGFRAGLLQTQPIPWSLLALSLGTGLLLLAGGAVYFRHTERVFADVI